MRVLAVCVTLFWSCGVWAQDVDQARIVVSGSGVVTATPDMATVSVGVQQEARTARQAMDATSSAMQSILSQLEAAGIELRDIQTTNIGLTPRYQHSNDGRPPRVTGYIASSTLSVRVRELEDLGGVLDAVVSDGANTLSGLTFGISDIEELQSAARADAVSDAIAKAGGLAEAAGVTLGPILSIVEGGGGSVPQPVLRGAMMEAAMDVPVASGEMSVRQQVTLTISIAN